MTHGPETQGLYLLHQESTGRESMC